MVIYENSNVLVMEQRWFEIGGTGNELASSNTKSFGKYGRHGPFNELVLVPS